MFRFTLVLACLPLAIEEPIAPDWGRRIQWPAEGAPEAREHAAFVVDSKFDRAVMLAGSGYAPYGSALDDAWAFDLQTHMWTELELAGDPLAAGGSQRIAAIDGGAYLYGGYGEGQQELGDLMQLDFELSRVVVRKVEQVNPPPPRLLHAFACDTSGETFVVFGGAGQSGMLEDTWIGNRTDAGVRWEPLESEVHPSARFGFSFAYDATLNRLIVCGGQVMPENEEQMTMEVVRDLWALDFTAEEPTWTRLAEYTSEEFHGRRNPAFALDQRSGDLLIWGGTGDGSSALPDLYTVRTRVEGAPVERLAQPDSIPTRASSFGVVDEARGRALFGFGNTGSGAFDDLVEIRLRR
ncbi:MAG: hypothetical protein ACI87A_000933 [Planctomycetota bacterium]|jgi:hypothetical protein